MQGLGVHVVTIWCILDAIFVKLHPPLHPIYSPSPAFYSVEIECRIRLKALLKCRNPDILYDHRFRSRLFVMTVSETDISQEG